jgi:hypothetical protein
MRIEIDGLVLAAVYRTISLNISVQAEPVD